MSLSDEKNRITTEQILARLQALEGRLQHVEEKLGLLQQHGAPPESQIPHEALPEIAEQGSRPDTGSGIEFKIGEYLLAWLGSLALLLGIVFLMTYAYNKGQILLSSSLGLLAAAGLFAQARRWQDTLQHLVLLLRVGSFLLLYYTVLRLHFFAAAPVIGSVPAALVLLIFIQGGQIYLSLQFRSELLGAVAIALGFATALFSDTTHFWLAYVAVNAAVSAYLALRFGWWRLLTAGLILAYFSHLLWLLNNPLMGHPLQAVSQPQDNVIYLFVYAAIFSWPTLAANGKTQPAALIAITLLNGAGISLLTTLVVLAFYKSSFVNVYLALAGFFLAVSVIQWLKNRRKFEPAFNACFGYMALSVAVFGFAKIPQAYLWLALQSLLVVSMALWYGSKIIIVVNTMIFASMLLAYSIGSPSMGLVDFSFALVALASARIMNWKKERLTLQTEMLRNMYLVVAYFTVLYGLYHAVSHQYVAVSWAVAAIGYLGLSVLLHNLKYRWMAIFTLLAAIFYLFVIDLARLEAGNRILAFILLGLLSLGVSLFYAKHRLRLKGTEDRTQK